MDAVKYDQKRFEEVKKDLSSLPPDGRVQARRDPLHPDQSPSRASTSRTRVRETPWYTGPTLLEALDTLKEPEKPIDKPLRLPIQDVYSISGIGTVPVGRVETGIMKKGMKVSFMPANKRVRSSPSRCTTRRSPRRCPGTTSASTSAASRKGDIRRGDVCGPADAPPTVADEFTAQIVILQHPSAITVGYTPVFHCHTAQIGLHVHRAQEEARPADRPDQGGEPDLP